jgi:hypothetical protein
MEEQVFAIVAVGRLADGRWQVGGRAYADVYIGDLLTVAKDCPDVEAKGVTVDEIISYGQKAPQLGRMMTGTLIVHSNDPSLLEHATTLFRPSSRPT